MNATQMTPRLEPLDCCCQALVKGAMRPNKWREEPSGAAYFRGERTLARFCIRTLLQSTARQEPLKLQATQQTVRCLIRDWIKYYKQHTPATP